MPKKQPDETLQALGDRIEELTSDLQRVQADFVNYKRRAEAERSEVMDFAKNHIIREFLTVRDNFDRELANRPKDIDPEWAKSIDAIRDQFDQVMSSLGVERFESEGQAFDHNLHDAIAMENGDGDYEVVVEELQPGYKNGNSVLRHAIVRVGKTAEEPPGSGSEPSVSRFDAAPGDDGAMREEQNATNDYENKEE